MQAARAGPFRDGGAVGQGQSGKKIRKERPAFAGRRRLRRPSNLERLRIEPVLARAQVEPARRFGPADGAPAYALPHQLGKKALSISRISCHFDRVRVVCTIGKEGLPRPPG